jgi:hypothetical protein
VFANSRKVFEKNSNTSMLHESLETVEISLKFVSQGRECVGSIREDALPQVLEFPNMAFRHTAD